VLHGVDTRRSWQITELESKLATCSGTTIATCSRIHYASRKPFVEFSVINTKKLNEADVLTLAKSMMEQQGKK
jgi:hypothetical protein